MHYLPVLFRTGVTYRNRLQQRLRLLVDTMIIESWHSMLFFMYCVIKQFFKAFLNKDTKIVFLASTSYWSIAKGESHNCDLSITVSYKVCKVIVYLNFIIDKECKIHKRYHRNRNKCKVQQKPCKKVNIKFNYVLKVILIGN